MGKFIIFFIFFAVAFIYTSVGLGGGSAYIAILSFLNIKHNLIPPTALFLNMLSSLIGFANFRIHFDRKKVLFYISLYLAGMLGVYIGTKMKFSQKVFYIILGTALIVSSAISIFREKLPKIHTEKAFRYIPLVSFSTGVLAGITGIGGGIYLSPILLIAGFSPKEIASITSLYIFINSAIGFSSHYLRGNVDFSLIFPVAIFVFAGAVLGSYTGSFRYNPQTLRKILNLIIMFAGGRLLWKGIT